MCGIGSIYYFDRTRVDKADLELMIESIHHRGPDDDGSVLIDTERGEQDAEAARNNASPLKGDLGLVNVRLAILDLTRLAHQPMQFRHLTMVYNGEIYNYLELGEELRVLGHTFRTRSDTEVLLHAYYEWGPECLQRLNGIFAFAVWDCRQRRLFCARDRLGVKPLYYQLQGPRLLICSEIKGLLAVLGRSPCLNEAVIYDHLTSGRLDHGTDTFFESIRRFPASHYALVTPEGRLSFRKYWEVREVASSVGSPEDSADRFRSIFHEAIKLQMRSDVPVACCLSGGLDSSAVVSVASALSLSPMRAYTARFRDPTMDEWEYAEAVHRSKTVFPVSVYAEAKDFWQQLPRLVWDQEEPFGAPGVYAQWSLMKRIHADGIKVVLDGQGGDELLCGYAKYFYFSVQEMIGRGQLTKAAGALLDALLKGGNHLFNLTGARRYLPGMLWMNRHKGSLLDPDFASRHRERIVTHPSGSVRAQQELDITRFSLPVLLRYEDKNSMAHSIESRVPFLDHRLVELAVGLPTDQKVKGSLSKVVMRQALAADLPVKVLERRGKLGFGGTYRSWIVELAPELGAWLRRPHRAVDRFVRPSALKILLKRRDPILFKSLILDQWLERFGLG